MLLCLAFKSSLLGGQSRTLSSDVIKLSEVKKCYDTYKLFEMINQEFIMPKEESFFFIWKKGLIKISSSPKRMEN